MFTIDFNTPIHVHFIGIGGISMSGLAKILLDRHFTVSGSDAHISDLTTELQQDGCIISYPQSADNITGDIDLVVYTAAIHPDNPELKAAVDAGIPTLTRAELLGQIMKNYHTAVNVAGTHGKTTTTSMITEILLAADADPTISVGGILNSIGGNIRVGRSDLFVTEACEYTNSFLSFNPTINIILNFKADCRVFIFIEITYAVVVLFVSGLYRHIKRNTAFINMVSGIISKIYQTICSLLQISWMIQNKMSIYILISTGLY